MTRWFRAQSIGHVERPDHGDESYIDPSQEVTIVIDPRWQDGLTGIEGFSHLVVLFWLDRVKRRRVAGDLRPVEGQADLPKVGFFATRTPRRPNPIGIACPRLIEREGNRLRVTGIDAWHLTPVIDLKPYYPRDEQREEATVPDWLSTLWDRHDLERK